MKAAHDMRRNQLRPGTDPGGNAGVGAMTPDERGRMPANEVARDALQTAAKIEISHDGETVLMTLRGQLDVSSRRRFDEKLSEIRSAEPEQLVIDLRELTFVDSTGLSLLLKANNIAREDHFRLHVVRSPAAIVQVVLEATGIEEFLPFVDEPPPELSG
jgi:anti-sigma B factor antagonist